MADLTTLDPTLPADGDPASQGASRMREERADILGFAAAEHALTGIHQFLTGNGTFPALPGVPAAGNRGRIFIDTSNGRALWDTGSFWQVLETVTNNVVGSIVGGALTPAMQTIVTANINVPVGAKVVVGLGFITVVSAVPSVYGIQLLQNAVLFDPPGQANYTLAAGANTVSLMTFTGISTGNNSYNLQLASSQTANWLKAQLLVFAL